MTDWEKESYKQYKHLEKIKEKVIELLELIDPDIMTMDVLDYREEMEAMERD